MGNGETQIEIFFIYLISHIPYSYTNCRFKESALCKRYGMLSNISIKQLNSNAHSNVFQNFE